jgi:predicted RNA polymerase sigma factor
LYSKSNKSESRRIPATLIRLLGGFDLAQEAPQAGLPSNPRAWWMTDYRTFKIIGPIVDFGFPQTTI